MSDIHNQICEMSVKHCTEHIVDKKRLKSIKGTFTNVADGRKY